jgi:hypothetical protein
MLGVWNTESVMLARSRVRLARCGRGIAGGENQVLKGAQDEARPAAFRRKTPEAQDLLLAEREGELRRGYSSFLFLMKLIGQLFVLLCCSQTSRKLKSHRALSLGSPHVEFSGAHALCAVRALQSKPAKDDPNFWAMAL